MSTSLNQLLTASTCKMLVLSTAHVSEKTCSAAERGEILWAMTSAAPFGFLSSIHEERVSEGADDLWDVLQFAHRHGYDYVLFDRDAPSLNPALTGLPVFDW